MPKKEREVNGLKETFTIAFSGPVYFGRIGKETHAECVTIIRMIFFSAKRGVVLENGTT